MGIVNATPDSFSGDGVGGDEERAALLAEQFERDGADSIDLGAESTRPGAEPVPPEAEWRRLAPILRAVRASTSLPITVDTVHAAVAERALAAGADGVNDIHGLRGDTGMADVVAGAGVPLIAMHNQRGRAHTEVVADICAGFAETLEIAAAAGIQRDHIVLDPGFGFGWSAEQNFELVRRLAELRVAGLPLLLGPSRKSAIGLVLGAEPGDRLEGTAALVALAIAGGADIVRVHDVREMARVARMSDAVVRANWKLESSP